MGLLGAYVSVVNFSVASRDVKESSLRAAFLFGLFKYHPEWVTAT